MHSISGEKHSSIGSDTKAAGLCGPVRKLRNHGDMLPTIPHIDTVIRPPGERTDRYCDATCALAIGGDLLRARLAVRSEDHQGATNRQLRAPIRLKLLRKLQRPDLFQMPTVPGGPKS